MTASKGHRPQRPQRHPSTLSKLLIPVLVLVFLGLLWGVNKFFLAKKTPKDKAAQEEAAAKKSGEESKDKKEAEPKQAEVIPVKVYKTAAANFEDVLPSIGTIRGSSTINLRFEQNGNIAQFHFKEGDFIKKGQIIAELAHQDTELKVKFRESKVETAKTNLMSQSKKVEMHEQLFKANAIVKLKLDEVKLDYDRAKQELDGSRIELESAKAELEKTYMPAPNDGILGTKDIEAGEFVTSSVKVASLVEITDVLVEMGIIEKDVEKIKQKQPVKVTVDAFPDKEFTGEVDSIAPTVEGSRTITIKARVPNPESLLLPGMFARVSISVFSKEGAIVIPAVGLNKGEEGYNVYIVEKDNTVTVHPVKVGYATSDKAQIDEGVAADQQVVIDAKGELKEGSKVEITDVQEG